MAPVSETLESHCTQMPWFNSEAETVAGVIHSTRHNQDHRERAPVLAPRLASPSPGTVSHCLSRRIWDYISHELLLALPFFQLENLQDWKPRVLDLTVWTTCTVFWWNEAPFYHYQEEKDPFSNLHRHPGILSLPDMVIGLFS